MTVINAKECCKGTERVTPSPVENRPGLESLSYRIGTHGSFLATMKASLSDISVEDEAGNSIRLRNGLRTREPDDFSIALLDSWAAVGDVLTFYQERIANEGFLRTFKERRSVLELSRLIGYTIKPGLSASTDLAFSLDKEFSQNIEAGVKAQSLPQPGEQAQIFETSEDLKANWKYNEIKPRQTRPIFLTWETVLSRLPFVLYFKGIDTKLTSGQALLFDCGEGEGQQIIRFIRSVEILRKEGLTKVIVREMDADYTPVLYLGKKISNGGSPAVRMAAGNENLNAMANSPIDATRSRIGVLGAGTKAKAEVISAPSRKDMFIEAIKERWRPKTSHKYPAAQAESPRMTDAETRVADSSNGGIDEAIAISVVPRPQEEIRVYAMRLKASLFGSSSPIPANITGGNVTFDKDHELSPIESADVIWLDNSYDILQKSWIVIQCLGSTYVSRAKKVEPSISIARYRMSGKTTRIVVEGFDLTSQVKSQDLPKFAAVRSSVVYAQSEDLTEILAEEPLITDVFGKSIELDGYYSGLDAGRSMILSGQAQEGDEAAGLYRAEKIFLAGIEHGLKALEFGDPFPEIAIEKSYEFSAGGKSYVLRWDKIPGDDSNRLKEFILALGPLLYDWVNNARIKKTDGNTIKVSDTDKSISLKLNDNAIEVNTEPVAKSTSYHYTISILNRKRFAEELFDDMPGLQPSEDNRISSRIWIDIFQIKETGNGEKKIEVRNIKSLTDKKLLQESDKITLEKKELFSEEEEGLLYLLMRDRLDNVTYLSNLISLPLPSNESKTNIDLLPPPFIEDVESKTEKDIQTKQDKSYLKIKIRNIGVYLKKYPGKEEKVWISAYDETMTQIYPSEKDKKEIEVFNWNNISRENLGKVKELREFISNKFSINWLMGEGVNVDFPTDQNKVIKFSHERTGFISLTLSSEATTVSMSINDEEAYRFIAKEIGGKLNIYEPENEIEIEKLTDLSIPVESLPKIVYIVLSKYSDATIRTSKRKFELYSNLAVVDPQILLPGDSPHTILRFTKPLKHVYLRDTVKLYGNIVRATHGETRKEILGSGDARIPLQELRLRQFPLTYLPSPVPSGAKSTLVVRVDGLKWHETDSPVGLEPDDRKYILRNDDSGKTKLIFGNGVEGSRLPTGFENAAAVYRTGLGKPGNMGPKRITLLVTRPLGVKGVTNPLPATGGADSEGLDHARRNAPLAVMALDRLVSVRDYEDFARNFAGIGKASAIRLSDGSRTVVHVSVAGSDDIPIDKDSDLFNNLYLALKEKGDPHQPVMLDICEKMLLLMRAGVKILPDYQWSLVEKKIRSALLDAFGFDRREPGQGVMPSEVIIVIQRVAGVDYVDLDFLDSVSQSQTFDPEALNKKIKGLMGSDVSVEGENWEEPPMMVQAGMAEIQRIHVIGKSEAELPLEAMKASVASMYQMTVKDLEFLNPILKTSTSLNEGDELAIWPRLNPAQIAFLSQDIPEAVVLKEVI